ncbi:MAG: putative Ig domain-containing protein, partial [Rhodobiaceae bacterium]|nr:putative Ig domain-containing protein [Rhodobiaceae bacterium]
MIDADGNFADEPFARLADPVFDMVVDGNGRLWATTGGQLVELDAATGRLLGSYGAGLTQSVALAADGNLYVSMADGVAYFNIPTKSFAPFSSVRVDDLALAPDGSLWATSWPERGNVLKFDESGRASIVASLDAPLDSIAFGAEGTEFEGLAILTSGLSGGRSVLYALDLASYQVLSIAAGQVRGEGIASTADGRIVIAHGTGVDVIRPLVPPQILVTSLADGAVVERPVTSFSIIFSDDMLTEGEGSVLDPVNFALFNENGGAVPLTDLRWNAIERTLTVDFEPLARGSYQLAVSGSVRNTRGVALGEVQSFDFTRIDNITTSVGIAYANTRLDRLTGTVTYDVTLTNNGDVDLVAPLLLTLDAADPAGNGTPLNGQDSQGIFLIDLSAALGEDGRLRPGESVAAQAISILLDANKRIVFEHGVRVLPSSNVAPTLAQPQDQTVSVGESFSYQLEGSDSDGILIGYVLLSGPDGLSVDLQSGLISWVPEEAAPALNQVVVRVYDARGAYDEVSFSIVVDNGNHAPTLEQPNSVISLVEGEEMRLPYIYGDEDNDLVALFADNIPAGAWLDRSSGELVWTPAAGQAGTYRNITIGVTDGKATTTRVFDITVARGDFPPVVQAMPVRVVREGDPVIIAINAIDPEGKALSYSSPMLPAGATLNPDTGIFEWTPGYTQAGEWTVPVVVSDGAQSRTVALSINVINANGAPILDGLGDWSVAEGQALVFRTTGLDPDNPAFVLPERNADGDLLFYEGSGRVSVSYEMLDLPDGATFDPETGTFAWQTDYADAGTYTIQLIATDDGDGTGNIKTSRIDVVITVSDVNRAPELPDLPNRTMTAGEEIVIPLTGIDPDGELLLYRATATPVPGAGQATLDPTPIALDGTSAFGSIVQTAEGAELHLAPGAAQRGDWVIALEVLDSGNGGRSRQLGDTGQFVLSVEAAGSVVT